MISSHAQLSSQAAHLFLSGLYVLEFCPFNENEVRTQIRALSYTRWYAPHSPRGKVLSKYGSDAEAYSGFISDEAPADNPKYFLKKCNSQKTDLFLCVYQTYWKDLSID